MRVIILYVLSLLIMGLVIGGTFEMAIQRFEFWILVLCPLILIWIGWKMYGNEEKIIKGIGIFLIALMLCFYGGVLISEKFRVGVCEKLGITDYISLLYNSNLDCSFWKAAFLLGCEWILCKVLGIYKKEKLNSKEKEKSSENLTKL